MSEGDEPGQEKTEEPTERRLRKARPLLNQKNVFHICPFQGQLFV